MGSHFIAVARAMFGLLLLVLATLSMTISSLAAQQTDNLRAILITGATSGIGLRMTEVLSQNGFFIYAGARKREDMERLNAMDNVQSVRLDVTIQSDIDAAARLIETEGRGLYGLINNAGVSIMGPLIETPEADMNFLLDVNLYGPYRITNAFADLLIESRGRIMNVSSIAGILSSQYVGVYSISKHGLEAYTDTLAAELARFGVAVAAVEPGNYKSKIVASMVRRMKKTGYSAKDSRYGSMLDLLTGPLDRSQYKDPDDVAMAALDFLTTDRPKRRYMVVPNQAEAEITIRQALLEAVQLNDRHRFSYSRDQLVQMLDQILIAEQTAASQPALSSAETDLHKVARSGDLSGLLQQLAAGADLDAKDLSGTTPLIIAATFGKTEIVKSLIAAGADVDQQNNDGSTALLVAALFCRTEIVEALLASGADKQIRNQAGSTALDAVTVRFSEIKAIYDYLGTVLKPYGLELDYERIKATRPKIAEMLR